MQNQLFHEYFKDWIEMYKQGAVRPVTYKKYVITLKWLTELAPDLKLCDINKRSYQQLLNKYAETHERQTVTDFHHHLKAVILDIIDEGMIKADPTRKVVIKGMVAKKRKDKFLNQDDLQALLKNLVLTDKLDYDWLILLIAKTGLRFSEALGLTPDDFDFTNRKIKITKTWNYKDIEGGFAETKNQSSKRTIQIDTELNEQFAKLVKDLEEDKPIFVKDRVFNSTINNRLKTLCIKANITIISIHSLRHTHASILIFAGVSIASVSKRLGHSNITTTQETYLHIIKELEDKDNEKITSYLAKIV